MANHPTILHADKEYKMTTTTMNLNLCNDQTRSRFTTFQMVLKTPYNNTLFTFHIIHVKLIQRRIILLLRKVEELKSILKVHKCDVL